MKPKYLILIIVILAIVAVSVFSYVQFVKWRTTIEQSPQICELEKEYLVSVSNPTNKELIKNPLPINTNCACPEGYVMDSFTVDPCPYPTKFGTCDVSIHKCIKLVFYKIYEINNLAPGRYNNIYTDGYVVHKFECPPLPACVNDTPPCFPAYCAPYIVISENNEIPDKRTDFPEKLLDNELIIEYFGYGINLSNIEIGEKYRFLIELDVHDDHSRHAIARNITRKGQ